MDKLNLTDIYNITRTLLKYKANTEVWVSSEVMAKFTPIIDKAIKGGAIMYFEQTAIEKTIMVAGFTFIEKPGIKGIMCFGGNSSEFNEKDTSIEEFL